MKAAVKKVAGKGASPAKRAVKPKRVAPPAMPKVVEVGDVCGTCKFYLADQVQKDQGVCRRYPATPFFVGNGTLAAFPGMQSNGWCGEFKSKTLPRVVKAKRA